MRIDKYLAERYPSRTKAAEAVSQGFVLVNGEKVAPSYEVKDNDIITFPRRDEEFISNGGYKLSKAIKDFNFDVRGKIFADIGASNGGFTDCLFKNGAQKVYCIDVGENQLDSSLKDKNIVIYDNFNARHLSMDMFGEELDGVVIDVSFISLTLILGGVAEVLSDGKDVIALIKPQFELNGAGIGKRGVVRDAVAHRKAIERVYNFAAKCSLNAVGLTNAPIKQEKNKEYLIHLVKNGKLMPLNEIIKCVKL